MKKIFLAAVAMLLLVVVGYVLPPMLQPIAPCLLAISFPLVYAPLYVDWTEVNSDGSLTRFGKVVWIAEWAYFITIFPLIGASM